jgi:hypothetical protein
MEIRCLGSASQAQAILLALQSGDVRQVRWEVDAVAALIPPDSNTNEMERIDLLNGVAGELRGITQPLNDPQVQVCRDLLQHLAYCPRHGIVSANACPPGDCLFSD